MNTRIYVCSTCGAKAEVKEDKRGFFGTPRTKGGRWKDVNGSMLCTECLDASYVKRSVTLPVLCPKYMTWGDLDSLVNPMLRQATMLANWAVQMLRLHDVSRVPGMEIGRAHV